MKPTRCPFCFLDNTSAYDMLGFSYCYDCKKKFSERDETKDLFHRTWGFAKERVYVRELWDRLKEKLGF